jgi:hypothetical protein
MEDTAEFHTGDRSLCSVRNPGKYAEPYIARDNFPYLLRSALCCFDPDNFPSYPISRLHLLYEPLGSVADLPVPS